jgi:predicted RNase H-like HicB family nuclease
MGEQEFNLIIEQGEDGYFVSEVVELPGCHTQAKSIDELLARTKEAVTLYLECQKEPRASKHRFIGVQKITV